MSLPHPLMGPPGGTKKVYLHEISQRYQKTAEAPSVSLPRQDALARALARANGAAALLEQWVKAYTVALLEQPHAQTAEGRSRALNALREMLMNAILDGVKEARGRAGSAEPDV